MRILVVEDEHKIANSIKKGLEQETYSVDVTFNGNEGYDMASEEEYDVIILDRMLPGIDGLQICQKLRERGIHTPILILTAKSQLEDKIEGLNAGADDYLTKPFAFEELLARIRALSRRLPLVLDTKLKYDDIELDTINYTVFRSGKNIKLSKKEFSLLEYFMRNINKILTKDNIQNHVWNYDSNILPNTIEQTIRYLRNKIDMPFSKKKRLVHTIRGFGYKFGENNV